jgi:hypothetical protein
LRVWETFFKAARQTPAELTTCQAGASGAEAVSRAWMRAQHACGLRAIEGAARCLEASRYCGAPASVARERSRTLPSDDTAVQCVRSVCQDRRPARCTSSRSTPATGGWRKFQFPSNALTACGISRSKAAVLLLTPLISPQHVVPLQSVVDRWPLNRACLVARQGRLRMPPKGQAPERQNKQRTGPMDRFSGRCVRGERLVGHVPQGHWKTITFVAALRRHGMRASPPHLLRPRMPCVVLTARA